MTYSSKELLARGVAAPAVRLRKWRRERGLTRQSMATMLGVSIRTLDEYELGKRAPTDATKDKIAAFIERWQKVPAVREALENEVRRSKMRYRAAALGRCKARGFEVPDEQSDAAE